jgi:DNA-binding transcriptional MerR regulator
MEKALPAIPAKRYFTIGEVSDLCGVKPYVLRYWEQEFSQLKPMKRRGNRRYYQHHEVLLIRRIRELLYEQGFTISGARNRLSEAGGRELEPRDDLSELPDPVGSHAAAQAEPAMEAALAVDGGKASSAVAIPAGGAALSIDQMRDELLSIRGLLAS